MTDQMREVVFPIFLGVGVGLITQALSQLLLRSGRMPGTTRGAWRMLATALALTVGVSVYMLQPKLRAVPSLARLSADEAAQLVLSRGFEPSPRYESSATIEDGLIIPESQRPIAEQLARSGVMITYAVSTGRAAISSPQVRTSDRAEGALSWSVPAPNAPLEVFRDGSGVHRAAVSGLVPLHVAPSHRLLLWVRPVRPPSDLPGWYLQRPPSNGVADYSVGGAWNGVVQLGNREFPPHDGDVVDLAVSIVSETEARTLEASSGAVTTPTPRGSQVAELNSVRLVLR